MIVVTNGSMIHFSSRLLQGHPFECSDEIAGSERHWLPAYHCTVYFYCCPAAVGRLVQVSSQSHPIAGLQTRHHGLARYILRLSAS